MKLFSADPRVSLNFSKLFFALENIKKKHPKKSHTYGSWEVFFLCSPQCRKNSPELQFRFINSFIQPSLVGSLGPFKIPQP